MKFFKISGQTINKDITKYLIKWNKKSRSKFQQGVKFTLYPYWKSHIAYEEFPVFGTKMTLDFVNLTMKIAVEVQGEQHQEYNPFFHNGNKMNFYDQIERDLQKKQWCELNKIKLIEIYPHDLPLTESFLKEHGIINS